MAEVKEMVNHPQHYNFGKIEVIEVVEDWKLGFNLGNAVKYIGRCEHKGTKEQDIKKAIWYLERELKKINAIWNYCEIDGRVREMKNYYFKTDRIEYQNKILDTLDNALNDLSSEDFDILIQRIQEYIDDLN